MSFYQKGLIRPNILNSYRSTELIELPGKSTEYANRWMIGSMFVKGESGKDKKELSIVRN